MRQAFEHQGAGALGHHEPVAVLAERPRGSLRRVVASGQRGQQGEADQALRVDRGVGADDKRGLALAAADRLDAELDRGRAGSAGGGGGDRRALGAEPVRQMLGDRAEQEALEPGREAAVGAARTRSSGDREVTGLGASGGGRRCGAAATPSRPAARRGKRAGEIARGARCRTRPVPPPITSSASALGQGRGGRLLDRNEIDGAGDGGAQAADGEAGDPVDAGDARGQRAPVSSLPWPSEVSTPMPVTTTTGRPRESRLHRSSSISSACFGGDGWRGVGKMRGGGCPLASSPSPSPISGRALPVVRDPSASGSAHHHTPSTRAMASPRQWPQDVTSACRNGPAIGRLGRFQRREQPPLGHGHRRQRQGGGKRGSSEWPSAVATARTGRFSSPGRRAPPRWRRQRPRHPR